jgi:hypothetical protein
MVSIAQYSCKIWPQYEADLKLQFGILRQYMTVPHSMLLVLVLVESVKFGYLPK